MDATQSLICQQDLINPLTTMGIQMSGILVLSHLFHLLLKAVGNSGPVAQILAGLAIGPTGLSRITKIGLETDISYAIRNLRTATTVAYGGILVCMVLGAELKIATSEVGRLAVLSSLVNDMSCLLLYTLVMAFNSWKSFGRGILCLIVTVGLIFANKYLAFWFNRRNRDHKYLKNTEVFIILSIVIAGAMIIELMSFNSSINCFLLGVMFPREGKSARTLLFKLTYAINNFVLPIYFGYIGFQFNGDYFKSTENIITAVILTGLSVGGKLSGTLVACQYLKFPMNDAILIGFLLNLKGHVDLVMLTGVTNVLSWTMRAHDLLLITIVTNTVLAGVAVSFIMRREEKRLAYEHRAIERLSPDNELRIITCVYGSRHVAAALGIISAFRGSPAAPISPYLMHLIELPEKNKNKALYHELEDDELGNDEDYGGNDVVEINDAVDAFTVDTKILIHQVKAVSSFGNMYEDVCDGAEDLRVSMVILPFHKHQRIDGKMEAGKEGIRTTNQRVLRHAPCSVGIIVNRGPAGIPGFSQIISSETSQPVATLFFGGADDQEALACSKRLAAHPCINLTVIRFTVLPTQMNGSTPQTVDEIYLTDFYNRYIRSGQVRYEEKCVSSGRETLAALKDMGDKFALFIVGRGRRGQSPITTGLSDWEECPELGIVGDVLASSEVGITGSVLIIQQYRNQNI
ncbi:hypothetical protein MLD38_031166 [Melastoma candidum]|uniref:Uncharacterized protein n=1 Tax=Melastoma candidum TaxID=119954 RepID=A0ACB9MPF3_9MYRT|nr:hypothetical protein MLD38_031166 [Melastoma candidum]